VFSIVVQSVLGGIEEITVLTLASKRTVAETSAPDVSATARRSGMTFRTGEQNAANE
jgi:hypothetical protein